MIELLTPKEMGEVDRRAIAAGPLTGLQLMQRAGQAVAEAVLARFPAAARVAMLCGPGNNGGDGYVIAEILRRSGVSVEVFAEGAPRAGSDAELAARDCFVPVQPLAAFAPRADTLVVDALYGAGLDRPVSDEVARVVEATAQARCGVVAVDLPSGVSGESGAIMGHAFQAALTVTFVRRKPGHLLHPGRLLCGETLVADIGIPDAVVEAMRVGCFVNQPKLWRDALPRLSADTHKYARGHVAVVSGPSGATGAARLAAMAAARAGAGAVTVLSPPPAMAENAAHLTSIMLRAFEADEEIVDFIAARRVAGLVFGPGLDPNAGTAAALKGLLERGLFPTTALVVDASALTAIAADPAPVFAASRSVASPAMVMTPHEGEFARLFPDLAAADLSKLERARRAAARANAVVVYKGPDTVIALPDGRAAINANGTPLLATAGSGDVLGGAIAGLGAQGMPLFEAACAAVWLHAEAGRRFGAGLIAEDLPLGMARVAGEIMEGRDANDA